MTDQDSVENQVKPVQEKEDTVLILPEHVKKQLSDTSTLGEASVASSMAPSNKTERLAALFPTNNIRFKAFSKTENIFVLLSEVLQLDASFVARMEACGFVLPSTICNRFGLSVRSIAEVFSMMGTSHVLDPHMHAQTMNLVIFACTQQFDGSLDKPP